MTRFLKVLVAAFTLAAGSLALAATSDQLAATKHNFNAAGGGYPTLNANNTICEPCHTPHHAFVDAAISTRLWNHALSSAAYTLYEDTPGGAYTGNIDGSQGMDRVSRLCLGCHDGTVALDSFGMGPTGSPAGHVGTLNFTAGDVANLGTDFRDDHPVGITGRLLNPDGSAISTYYKAATLTYNTAGDPLSGVKSAKVGTLSLMKMSDGYFVVGCKSCHNPHGSGTVALTPNAHLLAVTPETLCNTCHYK